MNDILLSDVRQVTLYFVTGPAATHMVLASELDRFIEASKQLHFRPGKNPHNGASAAAIYQIGVAPLKLEGPYWWATPGLGENGDLSGARVIDGYSERTVWRDEVYFARLAAEEAEAEAKHFRELEHEALAAQTEDATSLA